MDFDADHVAFAPQAAHSFVRKLGLRSISLENLVWHVFLVGVTPCQMQHQLDAELAVGAGQRDVQNGNDGLSSGIIDGCLHVGHETAFFIDMGFSNTDIGAVAKVATYSAAAASPYFRREREAYFVLLRFRVANTETIRRHELREVCSYMDTTPLLYYRELGLI